MPKKVSPPRNRRKSTALTFELHKWHKEEADHGHGLTPGSRVKLTESDELKLVDRTGEPLPAEVQLEFFEQYSPSTIELIKLELRRHQTH